MFNVGHRYCFVSKHDNRVSQDKSGTLRALRAIHLGLRLLTKMKRESLMFIGMSSAFR